MRGADCPTDDELTAFATGGVTPPALDRLADHLHTCPACQGRLEGLDHEANTVLKALRSPPPDDAGPGTVVWVAPAEAAPPEPAALLPAVTPGRQPGTWPLLEPEVRDLLHRRLRAAAIFGTVSLTWLFLESFGSVGTAVPGAGARVNYALLGLSALVHVVGWVVLWSRRQLSLAALRVVEAVFLGSIVLCMSYFRYAALAGVADEPVEGPGHLATVVQRITLLSNMHWFFMIVAFGMFVPHTWRVCAAVVTGLVLLPVVLMVAAGRGNPPLAEQLPFLVGATSVALFLAGGMAVFGSFKIGALQREAAAARQQARELGQYRLKEKLGAGGMGEVYLAEHRLLKRPCAVKIIRPQRAGDAETLKRFEREVTVTARLRHPNTVEIYDYGHAEDGTFYYVMEYLPGLTLDDLVRRHGPLPPALAVHLLRQLCGALRVAHEAGLVHRDLKPSNVILAPEGSPHDRVKLLDFGLVHPLATDGDTRLTLEGTVVGTPDYMSPEQAEGAAAIDGRSDLYSLGAVAYYLLSGRPPFRGDTALRVLMAHVQEAPPSLRPDCPDVPDDLDRVVQRCLAKVPGERFPDAVSLERALAECACAGEWTEGRSAGWWAARRAAAAKADGAEVGAGA